ncbi:hypothetical protein GWI33_000133 [Rhynchophorus ferrugineus]|uniref:Uncharacterized protein n=1 Tax=Rhynchophorus ferrugineus TaxID=354439 RepID=A0A834IX83_RHYFE|nr:hypothetical protein GWI33_000133 [Rhynchophorus ferrugineus]
MLTFFNLGRLLSAFYTQETQQSSTSRIDLQSANADNMPCTSDSCPSGPGLTVCIATKPSVRPERPEYRKVSFRADLAYRGAPTRTPHNSGSRRSLILGHHGYDEVIEISGYNSPQSWVVFVYCLHCANVLTQIPYFELKL